MADARKRYGENERIAHAQERKLWVEEDRRIEQMERTMGKTKKRKSAHREGGGYAIEGDGTGAFDEAFQVIGRKPLEMEIP